MRIRCALCLDPGEPPEKEKEAAPSTSPGASGVLARSQDEQAASSDAEFVSHQTVTYVEELPENPQDPA